MRSIAVLFSLFFSLFSLNSCTPEGSVQEAVEEIVASDTIPVAEELVRDTLSADDIIIEKELLYDKYTLEEKYPYKDTVRMFQWNKIRARLAFLENIQQGGEAVEWAVLQNYKNKNREAPLVATYVRNSYGRVSDTLGVERYQSVPLYAEQDTSVAVYYGRDGWLVKYRGDEGTFIKVEVTEREGQWLVPKRYIKHIGDSIRFDKAIFVDVTNQNIASLEKGDSKKWLIRSMNPATTGVHRPPYAQETPLGLFVIQEQKSKMIFLKDGTTETGGFAPWASRFSNGGYIHGVPTNVPSTNIIEYSATLGTIPRSHMCIRNVSSHAKFIYDWAIPEQAVLFVFD